MKSECAALILYKCALLDYVGGSSWLCPAFSFLAVPPISLRVLGTTQCQTVFECDSQGSLTSQAGELYVIVARDRETVYGLK